MMSIFMKKKDIFLGLRRKGIDFQRILMYLARTKIKYNHLLKLSQISRDPSINFCSLKKILSFQNDVHRSPSALALLKPPQFTQRNNNLSKSRTVIFHTNLIF